MPFLSSEAIEQLGFKSVGKNVQISDKCSIYGAACIQIGDHVRIDDYCIISAGEGGIIIGNHVHIACFCILVGKGTIKLGNFSGLSSRVALYSSSDDYGGEFMTNPTVPSHLTNVTNGKVVLEEHAIVGTNSTILPNVTVGRGGAVGAHSLVLKNVEESVIVMGTPARKVGYRSQKMFELESNL